MSVARPKTRRAVLLSFAGLGLAAVAVYLFVCCVRIVRQAHAEEARPADAIVVFGAAEYSGRPSPIFRARLDHAAALHASGYAPVIITSGGSGGDPKYTEGQVGHDYLLTLGLRDPEVIAETQGDNSAESAERIATIMRANGWHSCIAVSDPYHLFRAKHLLRAQGLTVYASGRPVEIRRPVEFKAATVVREALSYTAWRLHLTGWY